MHPFYDRMTDRARKALEMANDFAKKLGSILVNNLHILWGLLEEDKNVASQILKNLKTDRKQLQNRIVELLEEDKKYKSHSYGIPYDEDARATIVDAISQGTRGSNNVIGCQHLLLAILSDRSNAACKLLENNNVTQELVTAEIKAIVKQL